MKGLMVALMLAWCAGAAGAGETVGEFAWSRLQAEGDVKNGKVVPAGEDRDFESLLVESDRSEAAVITVLTIDRPKITASTYALRGEVSYEKVEGTGYLEMWSHFADGGACFSRTLASSGVLRNLSGSSDWRPFSLPFSLKDDARRPNRLVLNVCLSGKGRVELGPVRLVQYANGEDPLAVPGQWWRERTGGLIGGILGAVLGTVGAVVGVLCQRGRARGAVTGVLKTLPVIGIALLAAGVVALLGSQPYAVYYPLLLLGGLLVILPVGLLRTVRRRYEEIELRKMEALDKP